MTDFRIFNLAMDPFSYSRFPDGWMGGRLDDSGDGSDISKTRCSCIGNSDWSMRLWRSIVCFLMVVATTTIKTWIGNDKRSIKINVLLSGYNTKHFEADIKNKWRWEWLSEGDSCGEKWGEWLQKPEARRITFCQLCNKTINYKSNGNVHSSSSRKGKVLKFINQQTKIENTCLLKMQKQNQINDRV
jgi:hypothetical protein